MIQKTRGIVLHVLNYSEASVIAHIYTEEFGMQSFLLNGVRKARARFNANLLQPLSCVEVIAYIKHSGSLHRVSEFSAAPVFSPQEGDVQHPEYVVGLRLSRTINNKEQRIIVVGDADFMSNGELGRQNLRNKNAEFTLKVFKWLSDSEYPIDASRPEFLFAIAFKKIPAFIIENFRMY